MNYTLEKVTSNKKEILYNLLQFALYDGSKYIENKLNENAEYQYRWFKNYFTDNDREAYFIKNNELYLGFVMINENLKFNSSGKSIAEFLIMPQYRRNHIGKKVAIEIFEKYKGNWEVEPINNSKEAYLFWKKTIEEYTNCNYIMEKDVFVFNNSFIDVKNKSDYKCVIASKELIIKKWDEEIKKHNNSDIWKEFKKEAIRNINNRIVYMGILNNEIITEATAIISKNDVDMQNKDGLVGESTAYLSGFRTNKEYQRKGYFSKLYKYMEKDLKSKGYKTLTLGVEPSEIRNMQIYFKWGFTEYIKTDYEYYSNGEKILVNYYKKKL